MRILLDTHAFLWIQTEPERLGPAALAEVGDAANDLLLSAASSWEIAIKQGLGRLKLPEPPSDYVPDRIARSGVLPIAIEHAHALHVATLPPHHRDPFDRILIAQAQLEGLTILTADRKFEPYDVDCLWAEQAVAPPRRSP